MIEIDCTILHPLGSYHVDFIEIYSIVSDEAKKAHFPFYHWIRANETMSCTSLTCKSQQSIKNTYLSWFVRAGVK